MSKPADNKNDTHLALNIPVKHAAALKNLLSQYAAAPREKIKQELLRLYECVWEAEEFNVLFDVHEKRPFYVKVTRKSDGRTGTVGQACPHDLYFAFHPED